MFVRPCAWQAGFMADLMSRTLSQVAPRDRFGRVTVLTGAGLSAAAGLGTFRGADGRWTLAPELERAMQAEYVPDNIQQLWTVWGGLRQRARQAGPTVGHRVLAQLRPRSSLRTSTACIPTLAPRVSSNSTVRPGLGCAVCLHSANGRDPPTTKCRRHSLLAVAGVVACYVPIWRCLGRASTRSRGEMLNELRASATCFLLWGRRPLSHLRSG